MTHQTTHQATHQTSEPALVLDHVTASYGKVPALVDVHGTVRAGSSVALIGPNGAGKSTLIKAVLGLVPVVSGEIRVLGTTPRQARPEVAYVPQADVLDADFPVSVLQVVLMGRYRRVGYLRRPGRADRALASDALGQVGLADRAHDRFGTLSGGQRQRVLLARAIAQQPLLFLLDEPFNGIDGVSEEQLLGALTHQRAHGATVVMSTHDLALAHLTCDEVCLLNRHQVAFGPTDVTLSPARLTEAYGGRALQLAGDELIVAGGT